MCNTHCVFNKSNIVWCSKCKTFYTNNWIFDEDTQSLDIEHGHKGKKYISGMDLVSKLLFFCCCLVSITIVSNIFIHIMYHISLQDQML